MRILYVITGGDIGGAQKHVFYLAKWFFSKGHDVHVIVGEGGPFVDLLTSSGIKTTIIPIPRKIEMLRDFKAVWKIFWFLREGKFDIVHSHSSKAGIIARIAGFLNRTRKNIFTAHGFVFTDPTLSRKKRGLYLFLEKMCGAISTDIIAVSKFDFNKGIENGLNREKMTVIYNGIPRESIISEAELDDKMGLLLRREKMIIGFVGRFASEKNIDMLLRVAALFRDNHYENIEFWLIGDGPLYDEYKVKIEEQGLNEVVHLKGNQDDILAWMDKMNLLMITSHKEGLPFVLLEALSRGLPIISTDVGGVKEVLDPYDKSGIIVPINDDKEMYQKTVDLLQKESQYLALANHAHQLASKLTTDQMCSETEKLYQ